MARRKQIAQYRGAARILYGAAKVPVLIPAGAKDFERVKIHLDFYLAPRITASGRRIADDLYRPMDEDSARAAFKAGQDALKDCGIIPDDSAKYITSGEVKLRRKAEEHLGKQCLVVTLEVPEPDRPDQKFTIED